MELLKKGQEVEYILKTNLSDDFMQQLKNDKVFDGAKIDYANSSVTIKGLVVNDTEEEGFSVVAIDNTGLCLCMADPRTMGVVYTNSKRNLIRTGTFVYNDLGFGIGIAPTCQFK